MKLLADEGLYQSMAKSKNPYGDGKSAEKIVHVLKTVSLEGIIQKVFYD